MSKINAAESIRGLACMAVVLSHITNIFFPFLHNFDKLQTSGNTVIDFIHHSPFGFLYSGTGAVYVFFVLSGYVLAYAVLSKPNIPLKIESMFLKRYPRLAIPALVSCLIAYIVTFADIDTTHLPSNWLSKFGSESPTLSLAIYEGLIKSFIFGKSTLNWVLWSMQIELFGSFMLFALFYVYYKTNKKIFLPILILAPMLGYLYSFYFMIGMFSFAFGTFLYLYGRKLPTFLACIIIAIGLYLAGVNETSQSYQFFYSHVHRFAPYDLLNFLSGLFIVTGVLMNTKISKLLDNKVLVKLGELSFSIYLIHLSLLYIVAVPIFNLLNNLSINLFLNILITSLLFILITIVCSSFYSKYIDKLAISVANKIESKLSRNKSPSL